MANLQHRLPESEALSEAQEVALGALRDGNSFMSAAKQAGVARATLYRWVQSHPHFRAAYNQWQREMAESARARLLKLADRAVEVVEESLSRGDEKVAIKMLRSLGLLRRKRIGSVNPAVLDLRMRVQQHREEQRVTKGKVPRIHPLRFGLLRGATSPPRAGNAVRAKHAPSPGPRHAGRSAARWPALRSWDE